MIHAPVFIESLIASLCAVLLCIITAWETRRAAWKPFFHIAAALTFLAPLPFFDTGFLAFPGAKTFAPVLYVLAAILAWELGFCSFLYEGILRLAGLSNNPYWSPTAAVSVLLTPNGGKEKEFTGALYMLFWAPFAEELFYCGFLYVSLRPGLGLIPAAMAAGLICAINHVCRLAYFKHFPWPAAIAFGVSAWIPISLNCWLFEVTKSLIPLILVHFTANAVWVGYQWIHGRYFQNNRS